jgi:hypothetical protein
MRKINTAVMRFRDAVQGIWNGYLLAELENDRLKIFDSFAVIERELLKSLVLKQEEYRDAVAHYRKKPLPIEVRIRNEYSEVPVQYGRLSENRNVAWAEYESVVFGVDSKIRLIDFFDWNPYDRLDMAQVRVVINGDALALLQLRHVDFYL